jgi:prepilin-type processing-associated H-X9-DG protein
MISSGDAPVIPAGIGGGGPGGGVMFPAIGHTDVSYFWGQVTFDNGAYHPVFGNNLSWMKKRHKDRWNVAYCDGRVDTWQTRKLFDTKNEEVMKLWNRDNKPHREWVRDY